MANYYESINYDHEQLEIKHGDVPIAWVAHELIELPFPYDPEQPPTEQQLKELFITQPESEFIDRADCQGHSDAEFPSWSEIRHELAQFLKQPRLSELNVVFE